MSTSIFFHIAIMNNYKAVVDEIVRDIETSGLYDAVDSINVGVVGGTASDVQVLPDKYKVKFESPELKLYEKPTLRLLHDHSLESTDKVLYIHTKNTRAQAVSKSAGEAKWKSWASREVHRKYMLNFMVFNFRERLGELDSFDTTGCDFRNHPENTSHFAGNWWWANSEFIKTLPSWHEPMFRITGTMGRNPRHYCERWLLCYNNKDNNRELPKYSSVFQGAECRKNDSIIDVILSSTKTEANKLFNTYAALQKAGTFRSRI